MTRQEFHDFCLSLPGTDSHFPFDERTQVYRIAGKMFALSDKDSGADGHGVYANLKCDPALAVELRREFPEVKPGWHMNKAHWNTVRLDGAIPEAKIEWLIRHSWDCVVAGLPAKKRPLG